MSAAITTINVAGKEYRMAVPPSEESRVKALAARVDAMLADLRKADPQIDRDRAFLLTCLEMADTINGLQGKAEAQGAAVAKFHRHLADKLESLLA
jgi:cell division protein ZapA (FtsZ GTPase activity inhibitor)